MAFIVAGRSASNEAIQDGVGVALTDTATIDFTYDDPANTITADVKFPLLASSNGSASAPAYSWASDTNTGIYRIGADNLGFTTGGSLRLDINTSRVLTALPLKKGSYVISQGEANPSVSASITVDLSTSNSFTYDLDTNTTLTFTNPEEGGFYHIRIGQDGTGSRLVTWPAEVLWPNDVEPTLSVDPNTADLFTFYYSRNGKYYGSYSLGYSA